MRIKSESMGMMNWLTKVFIATAALAAVALLADSGRAAAADVQFTTHAAILFALPWTLSSSRIRPGIEAGVPASNLLRPRALKAASTLHRIEGHIGDATIG